MIQSLSITNIALIERLELSFHPGLNVLSGETGAGKSIVVDAVNLVLGGRADRDLIRTGAEKAAAEAEFDVPGSRKVTELLAREEIEFDGRTVVLRREISRSGKNLCRVCGVTVSLAFLRELAPLLLDIHGQHDHRFLLDPEMHLSFLDRLGDAEHRALQAAAAERCARFLENHRAYVRLLRRNEQRPARAAELEEALKVLRKVKPRPGEEKTLPEEIDRLRGAVRAAEALQQAYSLLSTGVEEPSALDRVRLASEALRTLPEEREDPDDPDKTRLTLAGRCETLFYEMQELSYDVVRTLERVQLDPERLQKAEKRLERINGLLLRYGSLEEALRAEERMEEEAAGLAGLEQEIQSMAAEHKALLADYRKAARELTESRLRLAKDLEESMGRELAQLGMGETRFAVAFAEPEKGKPRMPREIGDDRAEFLISPNPGEPLKPLARIASGGELSRLMLAFKTLESARGGLEAMVFDEIDTGISGRTAQAVAEKMVRIARACQVICVTHLPQIAAAADHAYLVRKQAQGDRTVTTVLELDEAGRTAEVARMISGAEGISEASERYAREMLDASNKLKFNG